MVLFAFRSEVDGDRDNRDTPPLISGRCKQLKSICFLAVKRAYSYHEINKIIAADILRNLMWGKYKK